MKTAKNIIKDQQKAWAAGNGIALDKDGYAFSLDHNLYSSLDVETMRDFTEGDGTEIGRSGKRGKMQAVHSSSALVVNTFMPLVHQGLIEEVGGLLRPGTESSSLRFEAKHTVVSRGANLDLELDGSFPVAVESKFSEPYSKTLPFSASYFKKRDLWEHLPQCEKLAKMLLPRYRLLDAAQLVKHLLGLAKTFGEPGNFHLLYLWYEVQGEDGNPHLESIAHQYEIDDFKLHLDSEVNFSSMTYQDLYRRLKGILVLDKGHLEYLGTRYFPGL